MVFKSGGAYEEQELNVQIGIEPDEIIWENLEITKRQQKTRTLIMYSISVVLLIVATLITLYLSALKDYLNREIPIPYCPPFFKRSMNMANPEEPAYKLKVLKDYW